MEQRQPLTIVAVENNLAEVGELSRRSKQVTGPQNSVLIHQAK